MQRERTVGRSRSEFTVHRINTTHAGGSSRSFSAAFCALSFISSASCITYTLRSASFGNILASAAIART